MNVQEIISEVLEQIRGSWRYRWTATLVAWSISLVAWFYIYSMPNIYEATTKVSVDTNRLLARLTENLTAGENMIGEADLVSKALLTRPNLEAVARETELDRRYKSAVRREALITSLQKRIKVDNPSGSIFTITFEHNDRRQAQDVVAAVLNTFIERALGAQGEDADVTERALQAELTDHEQRLLKSEADLAAFKKENLGYMPDDGGDYYERLQGSLASVRQTGQEIRLLEKRRDELQRQIEGEEPVFGIMTNTTVQGGGCSQEAQLAELQGELQALQLNFTDRHPRIMTLRETIAALSERCATEIEAARAAGVSPRSSATDSLDANPVYQNLRIQLSNAEVELAALRAELQTRQREVSRLRKDVDKIGAVETDLNRLNRDYGVVKARYQEMLKRWETLQSRKRLDPVTDNVQFTTLEPPFAPARPVGPDRPLLLTGALLFALAAGAGIAFALNQVKPVFYSRRSIASVTGVPVLGTISMLLSPAEKRKRRRRVFAWASCNALLILTTIVVIEFQWQGSALLRDLI
jgi:polysaccharide chain length determinant protein (PEP-CTERM system associated)